MTEVLSFPAVVSLSHERDRSASAVSLTGSDAAPQFPVRRFPWRTLRALADGFPPLAGVHFSNLLSSPRARAIVRVAAGLLRQLVAARIKFAKRRQRQLAAFNTFDFGCCDYPHVSPNTAAGLGDIQFSSGNSFVAHALNMSQRSNNNYGQQVTKRVPEGHAHD